MRKRVVMTSILAACLFGGVVFASGQEEQKMGSDDIQVNPAGVFPIVNEKLNIAVFMTQDPLVTDYDDNYQTKLLEEKTNIHATFQLVSSQLANEKMNLILASGVDLPDVIMSTGGNSLAFKYGAEGVFMPLNDLIGEYGIETKNLISDMNEKGVDFLRVYTAPDGNIYGLPAVNVCRQCEVNSRAWVDTEWLKKLDLEIPETVEEFSDMLMAFKTGDPNGNGVPDEIPMMGSRTGWGTQTEGFLMMPFIVYNTGGNRLIIDEKTGKVTPAYTQKEWLEGLKFINNLVENELLDSVSLTQTKQEMQIIGESEPKITGTFLAANFPQWLLLKDDKYKSYQVIPPLKGVTSGEPQTFSNKYQPTGSMKFFITETTKHPAAVFRWGDVLYSSDISMLNRFGKKGEDWVVGEPGDTNPFGGSASFREISIWGDPTKNSWRQGGLLYLTGDMQITDRCIPEGNPTSIFIKDSILYWDVAVANGIAPLFMKSNEIDEYAELNNTIDTYVDEAFARFITGDLPFSDWDEFQSELKNIGIERFIELNENAYRRQYME